MLGRMLSLAATSGAEMTTAVATVVAVVVYLGLGGLAYRQLLDARAASRDQHRPYVFIDFEVEQRMVYLVLQNVGKTAARDVHLTTDPPMQSTLDRGTGVRASMFIDRTWPMFPPGKRVRSLFDNGLQLFTTPNEMPMSYKVTATYSELGQKKPYTDTYLLDLSVYRRLAWVGETTLKEVNEQLKTVAKVLSGWDRNGYLDVAVSRRKTLDREEEAEHERFTRQTELLDRAKAEGVPLQEWNRYLAEHLNDDEATEEGSGNAE